MDKGRSSSDLIMEKVLAQQSNKSIEYEEAKLKLTAMDSLLDFDVFVDHLEEFYKEESVDFLGKGFNWIQISDGSLNSFLQRLEHNAKTLVEAFSCDRNQLKLKYICKIIAKWYYDSALYAEALVYYKSLMSLCSVKSPNETKLESLEDKIDYIRCLIETNSTYYTPELKWDVKNIFEDLKSDLELTNTRDIAVVVIKYAHCLLHSMLKHLDVWEDGEDDKYFITTNAYIIKLKYTLGVQSHDIWSNYLFEGHRLLKRKEHLLSIQYITDKVFNLDDDPVHKVLSNHAGIQDFCSLVALMIKMYLIHPVPNSRLVCHHYLATLEQFLKVQKLIVHDLLTVDIDKAILGIVESLHPEDDISNYEDLFKYTKLSPFITCFQTINFLDEFGQIGIKTFGANHTSHACFEIAVTAFDTVGKGIHQSIHCMFLSSYLFTTYHLQNSKMLQIIPNIVNKILKIAAETEGCELYVSFANAVLASAKVKYCNPDNNAEKKQNVLQAIKATYDNLRLYNRLDQDKVNSSKQKKDPQSHLKFQRRVWTHLILAKVFKGENDLESMRHSLLKQRMLNKFGLTEEADDTIVSGEKLLQLTQNSFT